MTSPFLDVDGAVEADAPDAGVPAHYGNPFAEQKALLAGEGVVDLSHRGVVRITGPDRLTWLHALTSQHLEALPVAEWTQALILSPTGHVEHAMAGSDDGESFWAHVEPGETGSLVAWLDSMRFMSRVEVTDATADRAVVAWSPTRAEIVERAALGSLVQSARPCGLWAYEALRIERGEPRLGIDTDGRTIPNEVGWIGTAVHMDKGCYRGQETVARVHNLGRPPRRLVRLLLDGSVEPAPRAWLGGDAGWRSGRLRRDVARGTTSSVRSGSRW